MTFPVRRLTSRSRLAQLIRTGTRALSPNTKRSGVVCISVRCSWQAISRGDAAIAALLASGIDNHVLDTAKWLHECRDAFDAFCCRRRLTERHGDRPRQKISRACSKSSWAIARVVKSRAFDDGRTTLCADLEAPACRSRSAAGGRSPHTTMIDGSAPERLSHSLLQGELPSPVTGRARAGVT